MEIAPRISVDEKIRFGKPVISGTRVTGRSYHGQACRRDDLRRGYG